LRYISSGASEAMTVAAPSLMVNPDLS